MKIEKIKNGFMHDSFIVSDQKEKVVLQKLNYVFGVIPDISKASEYLDGKFPTVKINNNYRVTDFIEGETIDNPNKKQLISALILLIKFHKTIKGFDAPIFKTHKVPKLKKEYQEIEKLKLPISVIHGDVKTNNFLFKKNKAVALIDLDMVNKNTVCWDFANFICSWCGCENGKINKEWVAIIFSELNHISLKEFNAISKIVRVYALEFHYRYKDYKYFNKLSKKYCDYRSRNALKFYKDFNKLIQII